MSTLPAGVPKPAPSPPAGPRHPRLRHARAVIRERLEHAALQIGAWREGWREVADSTRRSLGSESLPDAAEGPVEFLERVTESGAHALPIEPMEQIGSGGLNTVYRTRDRILRLPLVVRRPREARSAAETEQLLRHDRIVEERLSALPWHPVIPACIGRMAVGDAACEVYEYAPGINLRSYVAGRGLTHGAILDVARSAARGLRYLHRHGLVHADVKPENFCVEERRLPNGRTAVCVWLIDFDIIASAEEVVDQMALGDTFAGTPGYLPPETFSLEVPREPAERERLAFSKDVYALGVSLCQILGSERPAATSVGRTLVELLQGPGRVSPRRLPSQLPAELRDLILAMCRDEWRERPSLDEVIRCLRELRRRLSRDGAEALLVPPQPRFLAPRFEELVAMGPALGPYLVVNAEYALRPSPDGLPGRIMELQDAHGRRLLGVDFAFTRAEAAEAFYEERRRLLVDLNRVRRAHPSLFWGTFSDLVRTQEAPEGPFHVWFVRPLLVEAMSLREFLEAEPRLGLRERVAILRRVAEALAALEVAGYIHPGIGERSIFFVPFPASEVGATVPFQERRLFDVRASRPYHQELMSMAEVRRVRPGTPDDTVRDLLGLAFELGVMEELPAEVTEVLRRLGRLPDWARRAELLRRVETGGVKG